MRRLAAPLLCLPLLFLTLAPGAARAETPVDLELVLAVDASGSVDAGEFRLQMDGIAAALRDPDVQAAIAAGPVGAVAATVMLWAEANRPKQSLPWALLDDPAEIEAFAAAVAAMPRELPAGGTGIGKALQYAVWEIERNGFAGTRRVIDLSGDGRETAFREFSVDVARGRVMALRHGIAVNGLAILNEVPDLDVYYRAEVIGGPGAFVEVADDYAAFAAAMRRKLIREIEWRPPIGSRPPDPLRQRKAAAVGVRQDRPR